MASEALIGATAAAAVIVAQRAKSWDVAALVASLTDDADDADEEEIEEDEDDEDDEGDDDKN